jgi:hypothetical protein
VCSRSVKTHTGRRFLAERDRNLEGTLDAGAAKLKLVLHIDAAKDGALVGRLDSPDQGATDLPIDSLSLDG